MLMHNQGDQTVKLRGAPLRGNQEILFQGGKQWTAIARLAGAPSAFGLKTAGE
jgi:hypothetical protein